MKKKQATMKDIARKTGVSITTVSHVINKTRRVNQETRELVLEAMKQLEYDLSRAKRRNNHTSSGLIGVIIADVREDYYVSLVKAIETVATENRFSLLLCDSEMDPEKEKNNIRTILERNVSGLIIAPIFSKSYPEELRAADIPVVLVDRQYDNHNRTFVGINNFESAMIAKQHLDKKGCTHIGFIGYTEDVYTVHKRIMGYKTAVYDSGSSFNPAVLNLQYHNEDSYSLIKEFILEHKFDGLICATSDICYELVSVIDDLQLSVPEQIQIITYDDNKWLDYLKYPISVISQPTVEIGEHAVEKILHFLSNPDDDHQVKTEVFFDVQIIDR